eukprot:1161969-Pelagomonas_calceolata.AAC.4
MGGRHLALRSGGAGNTKCRSRGHPRKVAVVQLREVSGSSVTPAFTRLPHHSYDQRSLLANAPFISGGQFICRMCHRRARGQERDKIYITHDGGELRTIAVNPAIPPSMARQGLWRVEDFDLHKELYRGKTSLVYMATDKQSGIQVALKLYRKRKLSTMNR